MAACVEVLHLDARPLFDSGSSGLGSVSNVHSVSEQIGMRAGPLEANRITVQAVNQDPVGPM